MIIGEIRIFVTGAERFSGDKKFGGGCYEEIFIRDIVGSCNYFGGLPCQYGYGGSQLLRLLK